MNTVIISHKSENSAVRIIWYVFYIVQLVLLFRLLLELLDANSRAPFAQFIYDLSDPFVYPFSGLLRDWKISSGGVLDWNIVIAMFVYWIVAQLITGLIFSTLAQKTTG